MVEIALAMLYTMGAVLGVIAVGLAGEYAYRKLKHRRNAR